MRIELALLVSILVIGCGAESLDGRLVTPNGVSSRPPRDAVIMTGGKVAGAAAMQQTDASNVVVLQTTKLDRYAEVVGVVDVHEPMGDEQAALQRLREKAAEMGADAVVGVEFHHGEGEGEPTHLSGMAVRFIPPPALPMHD
jgi:uncharacterized protein YbjQ (UPF0145 family)